MCSCLQHNFKIVCCCLRFFWGKAEWWATCCETWDCPETWISQIHNDALSSEIPSLCSESSRCVREHVTQPCRVGEKGPKAVSSWIHERNWTWKNAATQSGSNPGLKALKTSGWDVPWPLGDLMQKHELKVFTKIWTVGHLPSSKQCWISASEITMRDILITKILLWQCQSILPFISSQPAFAECIRAQRNERRNTIKTRKCPLLMGQQLRWVLTK